ncbi:hypothetical protein K450DRAFT_118858 [Umbelopsis ramanniana AG]|uniref:RRM domain-containing protein n=1 Tax=Umbelopsis ramanniana AG TaxID=1314678 RepID=A0AAD5E6Q2_UMBRA|nr:uncharacterized protein K450DRAFT_118858 [Umbelopsis ramanniana AG]KAI8576685.1 hypothetical protein K450DRAFT_118858 [Umbelopsis ramanniana AG]
MSARLDERSRRSRSVSRSRSPSHSVSRSRSRSRGRSTHSNNWISVTNLTRNVTLDHVKEIFAQYGEIVSTDFPFNSKLQSNRGVSYIEYANRSDAEKAIAHMDNGQLDGKILVCVFGEPPRRRSPTPPPARRRRMYSMANVFHVHFVVCVG